MSELRNEMFVIKYVALMQMTPTWERQHIHGCTIPHNVSYMYGLSITRAMRWLGAASVASVPLVNLQQMESGWLTGNRSRRLVGPYTGISGINHTCDQRKRPMIDTLSEKEPDDMPADRHTAVIGGTPRTSPWMGRSDEACGCVIEGMNKEGGAGHLSGRVIANPHMGMAYGCGLLFHYPMVMLTVGIPKHALMRSPRCSTGNQNTRLHTMPIRGPDADRRTGGTQPKIGTRLRDHSDGFPAESDPSIIVNAVSTYHHASMTCHGNEIVDMPDVKGVDQVVNKYNRISHGIGHRLSQSAGISETGTNGESFMICADREFGAWHTFREYAQDEGDSIGEGLHAPTAG